MPVLPPITKTIKVRRTRHAGHWRSRDELISNVLLRTPHIAEQNNQLEHTYSSYVRIRDVALKTFQRRWTIGRIGERGSGISVLAVQHDDDDDASSRWPKFVYITNFISLESRQVTYKSHLQEQTYFLLSAPCIQDTFTLASRKGHLSCIGEVCLSHTNSTYILHIYV